MSLHPLLNTLNLSCRQLLCVDVAGNQSVGFFVMEANLPEQKLSNSSGEYLDTFGDQDGYFAIFYVCAKGDFLSFC